MPTTPTVILSDAHLGHAPLAVRTALHAFLASLPGRTHHLIINGDLFEFWFAYRTVIPRAAFSTLHALQTLRDHGIRLTIIGGNHDRWGGDFWEGELGAEYHARQAEIEIDGRRARIMHGDGVADPAPASRLLQRFVHHRLTASLFRWIHPDVGLRAVDRLARRLPGKAVSAALFDRSAAAQAEFARAMLRENPGIALLVMGHSHRPVIEETAPGRWYLNPGAWMDGYRYAEVGPHGPMLRQWTGVRI